MTKNINLFVGPLRPMKKKVVKGCGGMITIRGEETIKWKIEENNEKINYIFIHSINYVPGPIICLI